MKLPGHHQRPCIVQALLRVSAATHPCGRDRSFLGGIGQDFILAIPSFVVGLRCQRPGRVIDQFQIAFVPRHLRLHLRLDVEEHLIGSRGDHADRPIAYANRLGRGLGREGFAGEGANVDHRGREHGLALGDHCFQQLHGLFVHGAANVAGADVVIIGINTGHLSIQIDARVPVRLLHFLYKGFDFLWREPTWIVAMQRRQFELRRRFAQVGANPAPIVAWIQRCEHGLSIRSFPYPDIERNALGRLFRRIGPADQWRRLPRRAELLCRKPFHAGVRQNRGQRRGKAEAVGQHVFCTGFAELAAEVCIAIKNLANDRLRAGQIHIALLHRGAGRIPVALGHVLLQARIV